MDWTPLILTVAPNGAYKTKSEHPRLPMSPAELAETASRSLEAGAAMIHLHVRDAEGRHTLDPDAYRRAMEAIRGAVGDELVIQVTSEAGRIYRPAEQMQAIRDVEPEAVSLALRELIPDEENEPAAAEFFGWLAERGSVPQYILYNDGEVAWYRSLINRGVIPDAPHWVLFVLGRYTSGQRSEPADLLPFVREPPACPWSMCAFGPMEHACAMTASALGGHVRVGFENNLYRKDGSTAKHNAELVAQAAEAAAVLGRPLIDAGGLRLQFAP